MTQSLQCKICKILQKHLQNPKCPPGDLKMADGVLKLFLSAAINFHQIGFMRTSKIQNDHQGAQNG